MFSFRLITSSDLELILRWRTSSAVTRFMLTDIAYDPAAQQRWFDSVSQRSDCCYWLIQWQEKPVGVINLVDIAAEQTSWAFYLGEPDVANLGGMLPPYLYNFVFGHTCITALQAEVMAINKLVLKLHKLHGYYTLGEFNVEKNGVSEKVIKMQLSKDIWLTKKKFHRFKADFPVTSEVNL